MDSITPLVWAIKQRAEIASCRRGMQGNSWKAAAALVSDKSSDQLGLKEKFFQMERNRQNVTETDPLSQSASFLGVMEIRHSYPLWPG